MLVKDNIRFKELVSIVIPVYNSEKYIAKCLASLQSQSYDNIEVIIINDGSTDQTQKVIKDFIKTDKRFVLINKENAGVSSARNAGIQLAKGKYLIFVDSDDYVTSDYVETLLSLMQDKNNELACADYYIVERGAAYSQSSGTNKIEVLRRIDAIDLLHNDHCFQGYLWNKIFLKDVIIQNSILFDPDIKIWEDMLFCLKYLVHVKKIVHINKAIYYYVNHSESVMNDKSIWNEYTQLKALEGMWELLQPYGGTFKEYIRNCYTNTLAGLLGKKTRYSDKIMMRKIKELHGKLTAKHRIKVGLYKAGLKWLIYVYMAQKKNT